MGKQKQIFRINQPSADAAALSKPDHISWMNAMHKRVTAIEQKIGSQGSDSDAQSPVAPAPPLAKFTVTFSGGFFSIQITNPQNATPTVATAQNNQIGTAIQHVLRCSLNPSFNGVGDVRTFGPSVQTHYLIQLSGSRWWELKSTLDGKTFNAPTLRGPVGA